MSRQMLAEVEAHLASPLIEENAWLDLTSLADELPPWFAGWYLECRLDEGDPRLDLLGAVRPDLAPVHPPDSGAPDTWHAAWKALEPWIGVEPPPSRGLWVEFDDVSSPPKRRPLDNVHVCVDPHYAFGSADTREHPDAAVEVERLLGSTLLERREREAVRFSLDRLPTNARLIHLSVMSGRCPRQIKLYLAVPRAALGGYLERSGRAEIMVLPALAFEHTGPTVYCDLTLTADGPPDLGVVYSQPQLESSAVDPSRARLREWMVDAGLSCPRKNEALSTWISPPRSPPFAADPTRRLHRFLDLKVSFENARPFRSKAYLGVAALPSIL